MTDARFLTVTRVGRKGPHSKWIDEAAEFGIDTVLSAYEDIDTMSRPEVTVESRPGRKVEGYASFLKDRADLWTQYDYVCLFEEDLAADAATLAAAFEISKRHDLLLSQPALTHDSHFTYAACLAQPVWELRYVNFIEMMCPIFGDNALERVLPLFEQGLESGIDLVWCNLLSQGPQNFATLDAAPVTPTEPVGGNKSANGFVDGRRYDDDIGAALHQFELPWLNLVPFAGVTRSVTPITGRWALLAAAMPLLKAVPQQSGRRKRLRFVLTHLRDVLLRQPRSIPVSAAPWIESRT